MSRRNVGTLFLNAIHPLAFKPGDEWQHYRKIPPFFQLLYNEIKEVGIPRSSPSPKDICEGYCEGKSYELLNESVF